MIGRGRASLKIEVHMPRRYLAAMAVLATMPCAALANPQSNDPAKVPAGHYELDPRHASMTAKVAHLGGFSRFAIRFDELAGAFDYDPASLAKTSLTVSVDPKSIHTGAAGFDKQLEGEAWFDVDGHPTITFKTTEIVAGPDGKGQVKGDLTLLGVTKPEVLDVTFNGVGPGLLGAGTRMGFSGTGKIRRSDFGMKTLLSMASDDVLLDFEVEFVKK
jgi:polyisoprenoid-binding protein YceI